MTREVGVGWRDWDGDMARRQRFGLDAVSVAGRWPCGGRRAEWSADGRVAAVNGRERT